MTPGGDINVPACTPGLLVELAFHHAEQFRQPYVTGVLSAEDQGEVRLVYFGTAKAITSSIESDPSAVLSFDKPRGIDGAEVQALGHRLPIPH